MAARTAGVKATRRRPGSAPCRQARPLLRHHLREFHRGFGCGRRVPGSRVSCTTDLTSSPHANTVMWTTSAQQHRSEQPGPRACTPHALRVGRSGARPRQTHGGEAGSPGSSWPPVPFWSRVREPMAGSGTRFGTPPGATFRPLCPRGPGGTRAPRHSQLWAAFPLQLIHPDTTTGRFHGEPAQLHCTGATCPTYDEALNFAALDGTLGIAWLHRRGWLRRLVRQQDRLRQLAGHPGQLRLACSSSHCSRPGPSCSLPLHHELFQEKSRC